MAAAICAAVNFVGSELGFEIIITRLQSIDFNNSLNKFNILEFLQLNENIVYNLKSEFGSQPWNDGIVDY